MIEIATIKSNIKHINGERILYDRCDDMTINLDRILVILVRERLDGIYLPTNESRFLDDDTVNASFKLPRDMDRSEVHIGSSEMRSVDTWGHSSKLLKSVIPIWCKLERSSKCIKIPIHSIRITNAIPNDIRRENNIRCYRALACEVINTSHYGTVDLNRLSYSISSDDKRYIRMNDFEQLNDARNEYAISNNTRAAVKEAFVKYIDTPMSEDPTKADALYTKNAEKLCEMFFLHRANERSKLGLRPDAFGPYNAKYDEVHLFDIFKCKYMRLYVIYSLQRPSREMSWRDSSTPESIKKEFENKLGEHGIDIWNDRCEKESYMTSSDIKLFVERINDEIMCHYITTLFHPQPEITSGERKGIDSYTSTETKITYKGFNIFKTDRFKQLYARSNIQISDVIKMYMRYSSLGDAGQQTYTPTMVANMLQNEFGVKYEGFASPINARCSKFCSLMYDVDKSFGSMGSFCSKRILDNQDGNWTINPPFTESYYTFMRDGIVGAFERGVREDMLIFIKVPDWIDCEVIDWLKSKDNKYRVDSRVMEVGEFSFERVTGSGLYKLSGGLLLAVLSPLGKNHPTFGTDQMDRFANVMKETVPMALRSVMKSDREYINGYTLRVKVKEGVRDFSGFNLAKGITLESIRKYIEAETGSDSSINTPPSINSPPSVRSQSPSISSPSHSTSHST